MNEDRFFRVCTKEDLARRGCVTARAADRAIVVFADETRIYAVDNRCPHMGFPLSKGGLENGMITCPWHHARFDAASGCTFDLWADDVPSYDVEMRDGEVWVSRMPRAADAQAHGLRRLEDGMHHNLSLVVAKALLVLRGAKVADAEIVRAAALFGCRNRDDWSSGLTILTAMANLLPRLRPETSYLALLHGISNVADDCASVAPRIERQPLGDQPRDLAKLSEWLNYWVMVRHRDAAERTILTAIQVGATPEQLTELIFTAATERFFVDTGHLVDFCNKAFELLDLIGWQHAAEVLPTLSEQLVRFRGGEETNAWRHPVDLVPLVREHEQKLAGLGQREAAQDFDAAALSEKILGDDPAAILSAITDAAVKGASAAAIGKALAYAAAVRLAKFGPSNELGDWIGALHTFSYCNAIHQAVKRCAAPGVARGLLHGAMAVYLDRFLNTPAARLPRTGEARAGAEPVEELHELLNSQGNLGGAAEVVAAAVDGGGDIAALLDGLVYAVVREDAEFHTYQAVEAGIRQLDEWEAPEQRRTITIAMARYIAAHSPTMRSRLQTAQIALRLHRGEDLHEE